MKKIISYDCSCIGRSVCFRIMYNGRNDMQQIESSAAEAEVSTAAPVSGESAAPAESVSNEGDQVFYMITFLSGSDYWKGCLQGFEEAAAQDGVTGRVLWNVRSMM